jgi:LssY C-terminus
MQSPNNESPAPSTVSAPPLETGPAPSPTVVPAKHWSAHARRGCKYGLWGSAAMLTMYLLIAFVILPLAYKDYIRRHPALDAANLPKITFTGGKMPGDPLNVCLIGSNEDLHTTMLKAGWQPADPITLKSSIRIAHASLFKKSYDTAPVSDLYLWNRKQDLAYQYPGKNVNMRHHVRFWKSEDADEEGRPLWIGAATYDESSGIGRATLKPTHHIEANIDKERDKLFKDLEDTGYLAEWIFMENFHLELPKWNGGGDRYHTDGHLKVGLIRFPDDDVE